MVKIRHRGKILKATSPDVSPVPAGPRAWRVWLIVALWPLLVAQFAVDTAYTSVGRPPYPTITMPDFRADDVGTDGRSRITERTIEVINRDGSVQPIYAAKLLAPLHSGPASVTLDRLLKPSGDVAPELDQATVEWLKAQTLRLGLTPAPLGVRVVWQPVILDVRTLKRTPAGTATVREVRW